MYDRKIGVSILTNGSRLEYLQRCVKSLLGGCYYRPLVIGVFDNGSTDGTKEWVEGMAKSRMYGIEWRIGRSDSDLGCAAGTNRACELVGNCEYVLHVESDFEHLPQELTGEDKLWLRRAIEVMEAGADFIYLRRMVDEREMAAHWWSQWMQRVDGSDGRYMRCPNFWWSNNPHLHRTEAMRVFGVLPLDEKLDGPKGTPGWSKPELSAAKPGRTWLHRWGLFVHDKPSHGAKMEMRGCRPDGCQYGFFKNGEDAFCKCCDRDAGFKGMPRHAERFAEIMNRGG